MELDWMIHPKDITSENDHQNPFNTTTSIAPPSSTTTAPLPIPVLQKSNSLYDLSDYLHVFDDDEVYIPSQSMQDSISTSSRSNEDITEPQRNSHLTSQKRGHQENNSNDKSSTRYICNSEKVNSTQPSSPLNSIETAWTEQSVELLLANITDPIGKFLRDLRISPADAIQLEIMPLLARAPKKVRVKYGKRKDLSATERAELNRERNREHAKSTRMRRKIFERVLEGQLHKIRSFVGNSFTEAAELRYLARREQRMEKLLECFAFMNTVTLKSTPDQFSKDIKISLQYCIPPQTLLAMRVYDTTTSTSSLSSSTFSPSASSSSSVSSSTSSSRSSAEYQHHHRLQKAYQQQGNNSSGRPYYLARRVFTGPTAFHDMAQFTLRLLQIEVQRHTHPLHSTSSTRTSSSNSPPPLSANPRVGSNQFIVTPRWHHQSLVNLEDQCCVEDNEKFINNHSIQSSLELDFQSSYLYFSQLSQHSQHSPTPLESVIESEKIPLQNENNATQVPLSPISPSNFHHQPYKFPPLLKEPTSPPAPVELQFSINSSENDLLIQGRQGIGSFDVEILSTDKTRVSLAVKGQMIYVTYEPSLNSFASPFANSTSTTPAVASTVAPSSAPLSSGPGSGSLARETEHDHISSCHIHLDINSLALGFIQVMKKRFESTPEISLSRCDEETSFQDFNHCFFEDTPDSSPH